jgi:hypothetical protein
LRTWARRNRLPISRQRGNTSSKQQITDAAAHDKGFEAGILQVSNDFGRVGAEFFQPNAMFGLGNGEVTINIIYAR